MNANLNQSFNPILASADEEIEPGLKELVKASPSRFSADGTSLTFRKDSAQGGLRIDITEQGIAVSYAAPSHAFRALGILLGKETFPNSGTIEEISSFTYLGVMLDVSRNAVLRVKSAENLFRKFALMGINSVQLYMEDVYSINGEPFFGYGRGAYSTDELRHLDNYGALLGIEVVPCIQTLGHLEQVLQWPVYSDLVDVPGVLLIGEEKTYQLIERMLDTVRSCFRTKRIHIGMDEAHGVGQGKYRRLHGDARAFDILNQHLEKVTALCKERGLLPMMWSDMYFRIGSAINDYYDPETKIPPDVASSIPAGVDLVYWDYYHSDSAFYEEWIDRHRGMGKEPILATGGWNWGRLWTRQPTGFTMISASMKAARTKNVREAFITFWGDDGAECDPFSTLPSVQFFAESAYTGDVTNEQMESRFFGSCGCDLAPILLGSQIDAFPHGMDKNTSANFGKWILWHDPVLNFMDKCIPQEMDGHYEDLATKLAAYAPKDESSIHLEFVTLLSTALAGKTRLHLHVKELYREGKIEELQTIIDQTIPLTEQSLKKLWSVHRRIWNAWYKPFGWEVLDRRYSSILARLDSLRHLLEAHIADPKSRIEEFDYDTLEMNPNIFFNYARTSFPTVWR